MTLCRRLIPLVVLAFMTFLIAVSETTADDKYTTAKDRFEQLMRHAKPVAPRDGDKKPFAIREYTAGKTRLKIVSSDNFDVPGAMPIDAEGEKVQLGLKVWIQLDGTEKYVHPIKHKWKPKDRFYIWVESAVPVQIHLFQNYPRDTLPSKAIYPDETHPDTFSTVLPGNPFKLPVKFELDNDAKDEIVSLVVARPDSGLPINAVVTKPSDTKPTELTEVGTEIRSKLTKTQELMATYNTEARMKGTILGVANRLKIVGPDEASPASASAPPSSKPEDVQLYVLGDRKIHQFQLTIKKVGKARSPD